VAQHINSLIKKDGFRDVVGEIGGPSSSLLPPTKRARVANTLQILSMCGDKPLTPACLEDLFDTGAAPEAKVINIDRSSLLPSPKLVGLMESRASILGDCFDGTRQDWTLSRMALAVGEMEGLLFFL